MRTFVLVGACLLLATVSSLARASAEAGEVGLSLSLDTEVSSLRYPGTASQQQRGLTRLGTSVAYGLSDSISVGLGVSTSLASFSNAPFAIPAEIGTRELWSDYRDLVVPASVAVSLGRKGMVFFQGKIGLGVQWSRWRDQALQVQRGASVASRQSFVLGSENNSWTPALYAKIGAPILWRPLDHLATRFVPYVAFVGLHQWHAGLGIEVVSLFSSPRVAQAFLKQGKESS